MLCNSWIIINKTTGKAVYETWNKGILKKVSTNKYAIQTAYEYLCNLNKEPN